VMAHSATEPTTGARVASIGNCTGSLAVGGVGSPMPGSLTRSCQHSGVGDATLSRAALTPTERRGEERVCQLTMRNCSPMSTREPRTTWYRLPGSQRTGPASGSRTMVPLPENRSEIQNAPASCPNSR
jgi:hypothetical protein